MHLVLLCLGLSILFLEFVASVSLSVSISAFRYSLRSCASFFKLFVALSNVILIASFSVFVVFFVSWLVCSSLELISCPIMDSLW